MPRPDQGRVGGRLDGMADGRGAGLAEPEDHGSRGSGHVRPRVPVGDGKDVDGVELGRALTETPRSHDQGAPETIAVEVCYLHDTNTLL
jgi:hypothetical protein